MSTDTEETTAVYKITLRHFSLFFPRFRKNFFSFDLFFANFKFSFSLDSRFLPLFFLVSFIFQHRLFLKQEKKGEKFWAVNYRRKFARCTKTLGHVFCFSSPRLGLRFLHISWMPSRGELGIYVLISHSGDLSSFRPGNQAFLFVSHTRQTFSCPNPRQNICIVNFYRLLPSTKGDSARRLPSHPCEQQSVKATRIVCENPQPSHDGINIVIASASRQLLLFT